MAYVIFSPVQAIGRDGADAPESGAKLWFRLYDTTTPVTVYQDPEGVTPHANPVVAASNGSFAAIYWDNSIRTRVLKTGPTAVNPNSPDWQVDDIGELEGMALDGSNVDMSEGEAQAFRDAIGIASPLAFETRADASAADIDTTQTTVVVNSYADTYPIAPATYKEVADTGDLYQWQFRSNSNSRRWELVPDARGVNVLALGAMADGEIVTRYPWDVTGTDDRAAVQAAIDFATYFAKCAVYAPAGRYRIGAPLHAGYGHVLSATAFEGDGKGYRGEDKFTSTTFICDFSDGMGINIQGARGTRIAKMGFIGKNLGWIEDNNMTGLPAADIDDRDIANWVLTGLGNTRYAPYAGVCIDGYSGVAPGTAYPSVTYPDWTAIGAQYGKSASSDVLFDDVYIGGFVVGQAIKPSDDISNADFVRSLNGYVEGCAYGVSAGNTQGRDFGWDNVVAARIHTGFTAIIHGKQQGKLQGVVKNCHLGNMIRLLYCPGTAIAGPMVFEGCYSEVLWSLGEWGSTAGSTAKSLSMTDCQFDFGAQTVERGIPAQVLKSSTPSPVSFKNCAFLAIPSVALFSGAARDYGFENCNFTTLSARANPYEKLAHNALAGGIVLTPATTVPVPQRFGVRPSTYYNVDTGAGVGATLLSDYTTTQRSVGPCFWSKEAVPAAQPGYGVRLPRFWNGILDKAALSACTLVDLTLTITFTSRTEQAYAMDGPLPGDVIVDPDSGSVFFVRSRTTTTALAELQNNYRYVGGVYSYTNTFVAGSGTLYVGNSRIFTPNRFLQGDSATGTAIITNAGNADVSTAFIEDQIKVDDWLFVNPEIDNTYSAANAKVTARSNAGATITLSGNGTVATTRRPFPFWVRSPPTNV